MRILKPVFISTIIAMLAAACGKGPADDIALPSMEVSVKNPSASGCVIEVSLGGNAESYYMKVYAESAFNEVSAREELPASMPYTQEERIIERLSGEKKYCIAAIPIDKKGRMGEIVITRFELTEFDLKLNLYSPGEGTGADLNKYNTLKIEAYSNGLASGGRMAMSLSSPWRALKDLKGIDEAAEEVFSTAGVVELTLQQLQDMADRTEFKKDIMYFTELESGTEYTLIVCLEDLDGGIHYYEANGKTCEAEEEK